TIVEEGDRREGHGGEGEEHEEELEGEEGEEGHEHDGDYEVEYEEDAEVVVVDGDDD
ncbi:hypothetical protein HK102_005764, partial [Quaeritorhiza haematococci]